MGKHRAIAGTISDMLPLIHLVKDVADVHSITELSRIVSQSLYASLQTI
jgi:hypothetical protein